MQLDPVAERTLPTSADVVVIGAGIMGVASAFYLAQAGRSVVVIEKGRIAGEQSGRNWGWVRQQARDVDELPLMVESNRIWQTAERELGADFEWTQKGNLSLTRDPARIAFFEEWLAVAREVGLDSRLLTPAEVTAFLPELSGKWLGAMFTPGDGHAEPTKATRAFAGAAEAAGAPIIEECAVDEIIVERDRVTGVKTERGVIRTGVVICAAGVWSARLLRQAGIDLPVRIVRSTVASTTPIDPLTEIAVGYHPVVSFRQRRDGTLYIASGGWSDYDVTLQSFRHLRMFLPNYLKNRRMIRIHVGRPLGRDVANTLIPWTRDRHPGRSQRVRSPSVSEEKVRESVIEFRKMFPDLEFEVAHMWAGYIDSTPDAVPVIDLLDRPAGLVIATGFSGHGFGMGPIVGRVVTELVVDGTSSFDLSAFRLSRFRDGTYKKPRLVS